MTSTPELVIADHKVLESAILIRAMCPSASSATAMYSFSGLYLALKLNVFIADFKVPSQADFYTLIRNLRGRDQAICFYKWQARRYSPEDAGVCYRGPWLQSTTMSMEPSDNTSRLPA